MIGSRTNSTSITENSNTFNFFTNIAEAIPDQNSTISGLPNGKFLPGKMKNGIFHHTLFPTKLNNFFLPVRNKGPDDPCSMGFPWPRCLGASK